jgi:hypothetical protein
MNKVKKDAEESKAIEELGKQLIYKMLRQMETRLQYERYDGV